MVARHSGALVTTSWLHRQLSALHGKNTASGSSKICVLDTSMAMNKSVDGYKEFYQQSHIPGASYFNLHEFCPVEPNSCVKFPIPNHHRFQDYVQCLGITNDAHIVAYDRTSMFPALRTWWLFRLFGHTNVSVLDGGFTKWLSEGYQVDVAFPIVQKSHYQPLFNHHLLRSYEDIVGSLATDKEQIIDTREKKSFHGSTANLSSGMRGGHIPGSKNLPYSHLFEEIGIFKNPSVLRAAFEEAEVDLRRPIVATCQSAMSACALAAAAFILGKEDVAVYNVSVFTSIA